MLTRNHLRQVALIGVPAIAVAVVIWAAVARAPDPRQAKPSIQTLASFKTAYSLDDLVNASELIVIGTVSETDEVLNLSRNPANPTEPDTRIYDVGQVYQLQVQQSLKGQAASRLKLYQTEGEIFTGDGTPVSSASIQQAKTTFPFLPLKRGRSYLFFLVRGRIYPGPDYVFGPQEPWRFDLSTPDHVTPESPWADAIRAFPPRKLSEIVQFIRAKGNNP